MCIESSSVMEMHIPRTYHDPADMLQPHLLHHVLVGLGMALEERDDLVQQIQGLGFLPHVPHVKVFPEHKNKHSRVSTVEEIGISCVLNQWK